MASHIQATGSNATVTVTPEVSPVSSILAHAFLQDPRFIATAGGLLGLLVFLALLRPGKMSARRNGTPVVLLVGPPDAGKTSLFTQLSQNVHTQTHTSAIPSVTTFSLPSPCSDGNKQIRLVDLPGHARLRDELKAHLREAAAVVFVVDVQAVVRNASSVAETLPPILIALANTSLRLPPSSPLPKLLLLAHKTDLLVRPPPPSSTGPPEIPEATLITAKERLRTLLTREMERLKTARGATGGKIEGMGKVTTSSSGWFGKLFGGASASVSEGEGEGEDDEGLIWGGKGLFKWEDVEGVEIEWGASALGSIVSSSEQKESKGEEGNGLDEVKRFLWDV